MTALVPYDRGDLVDRAHREGEILETEHVPEGTRLHLRAPASLGHALAPYELRPDPTEDGQRPAPESTDVPASRDA
jgi:GTP-binding protein HflX